MCWPGNAERALELMVARVKSRVAFGGPLINQVLIFSFGGPLINQVFNFLFNILFWTTSHQSGF